MTQVATEQQWKLKYRELVEELEDKERAWAKLEAACVPPPEARDGRARPEPRARAAIDHVMAVLRTDPTTLNLDSSMTGLMRALKAEMLSRPRAPLRTPLLSSSSPRPAQSRTRS